MIKTNVNEKIRHFIYLFIFSIIIGKFQQCDISFPNPSEQISTKFTVKTNQNAETFNNLLSYKPEKTYDITISINKELKEQKIEIKELFVRAKLISVEENRLENVGKLSINSKGILNLKQCSNGFKAEFCCNVMDEVTFLWTAPQKSEYCVEISIAIKFQNNKRSFMEDYHRVVCGRLERAQYKMAGDRPYTSNCMTKIEPDPVKICNLRSTAVYRLTIENNWNHLKHWKDWPGRDGYVPKLTQYLGASHTKNFNIYHLGGITSSGVRHLCTNGTYSTLEKLFYKSGKDILSVIMARSLEATPSSAKRSALVVVNSTYHLVSFLSRIVPSPDWFTGVSRLDLCSGQCKWPDTLTVSLYPWDAGVFSGESYLSIGDVETRSAICPITDMWPKDNPFTKVNGKVQNIGTVSFKLIQEYNINNNNNCNPENSVLQGDARKNDNHQQKSLSEEGTKPCQVSEWSDWSVCSSRCGKGEKVRYRNVIDDSVECVSQPLKEAEICFQTCQFQSTKETCLLLLWSEWGQCNATCNQSGVIVRKRIYSDEEERKKCLNYQGMTEESTCHISTDRCIPSIVCNARVIEYEECSPSDSAQRFYFDSVTGTCKSSRGCHTGLNNFPTLSQCQSTCTRYYNEQKLSEDYKQRCDAFFASKQNCWDKVLVYRWLFDTVKQSCYQSYFIGCRGNANGFMTYKQCESHCQQVSLSQSSDSTSQSCTLSQWSAWSKCTDTCPSTKTRTRYFLRKTVYCNETLVATENCQIASCKSQSLKPSLFQKCLYSSWSPWSICSAQCGNGFRERVRVKRGRNCKREFQQISQRQICNNDC